MGSDHDTQKYNAIEVERGRCRAGGWLSFGSEHVEMLHEGRSAMR